MQALTILTKSERRILRSYKSLGQGPRVNFVRSLKTIAAECGISTKTVQRANEHFRSLGILIWLSGNSASWKTGRQGQPTRYRLNLCGFVGFDKTLGITPAMLREVRRQIQSEVLVAP